ncbi:hypothetical protein [Novilysobacter spongiicola]|nr:hypothetical protein [Lysobacter spongiicola]
MRRSIIRFSENVQLAMGLIAAIAIAVLPHYTLEGSRFGGISAVAVGHAVACLVALWSLRSFGVSMTLTATSLTRKSPWGEVRIKWDEMERLEIGPACMWLVFHGAGNRIWMRKPVSSLASWFDDENDDDHEDPVLASLLEMAEHHRVPAESGILTPFKTSRA